MVRWARSAVVTASLVMGLSACGEDSRSADAERLGELQAYVEDYVRCLETHDDVQLRDRGAAELRSGNAAEAYRLTRRAQVTAEAQKICVEHAGGSGLAKIRTVVDREQDRLVDGYDVIAGGIEDLAKGGAGDGIERGQALQGKGDERLGKTLGTVLSEYVDLGGDLQLLRRLRRAL